MATKVVATEGTVAVEDRESRGAGSREVYWLATREGTVATKVVATEGTMAVEERVDRRGARVKDRESFRRE